MPRTFHSSLLRATIAAASSFCLLLAQIPPALATTPSAPSPAAALAGLKPATQFSAEAVRYDAAVKAIAAVGSSPILTAKELQLAMAQVRRYAPELRYATSRLVALVQADRTFTAAVARFFVNENFAREFARNIAKDHTSVLRLDGAAALMKRMMELMNANAALIQKAHANVQAAMARITGKAQQASQASIAITAAAWSAVATAVIIAAAVTFPAAAAGATVAGSVITVAAVAAFAAILPTLVYSGIPQAVAFTLAAFKAAATEAGSTAQQDADAIAACVEAANRRYEQCMSDAAKLPMEERVPAEWLCAGNLAGQQAVCQVVPAL